jgi:preprotein translocase subunit SecA
MRIFASDRVSAIMQKLGMEEGEAIEHPWVTRAIENAQKKVEGRNFDIRKQLLEYDDVANDQRKVVYQQRNELMDTEDVSDSIQSMRESVLNDLISTCIPPQSLEEQWDIPGLSEALAQEFGDDWPVQKWLDEEPELHEETLRQRILDTLQRLYEEKEKATGSEVLRHFEKAVMLQVLDSQWKEHLAAMDYLRQGIGLRGYAQKNPKQEYKREAFDMFSKMLDSIKQEVISVLSKVQVRAEEDVAAVEAQRRRASGDFEFQHEEFSGFSQAEEGSADKPQEGEEAPQPFVRPERKIGRNEPCPCGSGKKYKHCHGRLT